MLLVQEIHSYYDLSHILQGDSLELRAGESVVLIGRNGAGKSTTLKSIVGIVPPRRGQVSLSGEEPRGLPSHLVARKRVAHVPEEHRIFAGLTVAEHRRLAALPFRDLHQTEALDRVYGSFPG